MSEGLNPYWGGLLGSSCAMLEMSLNWCSMGCSYCFANLNSPNRSANAKSILGIISDHQNRNTYTAYLLREKHPIVISNHVDPFADSNAHVALPILEVLTELDLPFTLQTKCGKHGYEALKFIKPTVFYISIMTMDEDVLRRVEPGAPTAQERFKFIETARSMGHRVCVGINPCVPDWIGDPKPLCNTLAGLGVESVWIQPLHLSNRQIAAMTDRERAAIGETVLNRARKRRKDPLVQQTLAATRQAALDVGLAVYDSQQRERSDYFKPYKETYKNTFPLMQDFVNYCYDTGKGENDPIYWEEYRDFFVPKLPQGTFPLRNHIAAVQYQHFWKDYEDKIPKYMTYETLLEICWRTQDIVFCPVNTMCFSWAADCTQEEKLFQYVDKNDRPILLFRPQGSKSILEQWEAW